MVIALVAALLGIITSIMSIVNEALAFPFLATAVAATNIVLLILLISIWRLSRK